MKVAQSCPTLCDPMDLHSPWNRPGQNTGVGSLSLLQGIFPTQGLNPGLPRCRQILYQLSHQESPRILDWVAYPFSSRSFQPRNRTVVSCITGGFLPAELSRKPKSLLCCKLLLPGLAFCVPWAHEPFAVFHYLHPWQRQDEDEADEEVGQVSGVWKWWWNRRV